MADPARAVPRGQAGRDDHVFATGSTCCRTRTSSVEKPRPSAFLADLRRDPIRWRATLYGYIACFCQGSEFSTFAFYLPVLFLMVGVASVLGTDLVTMALYVDRRDFRAGSGR